MLGQSQNTQAGNCKRVKCDTWIEGEVVTSVPKTFLPWWYCVSGTPLPPQTEHCRCYKASPRQALLKMEIPAQTTSGWCTPVPFLVHIHLHRCVHVHTPRGKLLPSQPFLHSGILLSSFLNDFLHAWPSVRSLAHCSPQRHSVMVENKQEQNCRGLALTFQWPPISLHLSLAPLSACFHPGPFGVLWSQVWSHWDVEMCV